MLNVKKVTSRDFQQRFGQIAKSLENGQSIEVTKRGRPMGRFIKAPSRTIEAPDFMVELKRHTYSVQLGKKLLKEFNESVS